MADETTGQVIQVPFQDHMMEKFLIYGKDVIQDRALSDVRDGLKPVHRRILYAMNLLHLNPSGAYKKCARTVGETLGILHPHGDQSVYEAMVGMAQDFKMRYPLVDGHGNFGSVDNDPPAAMRYTEAKLSKIGELMLKDIDKQTVAMQPNYDESSQEPVVLSGLFPSVLCNGSSGIAVGMTATFLPHCAVDVYKALDKILEDTLEGTDTDIETLIDIIKAPDFPTGGVIVNPEKIREAYRAGKGRCTVRAKYHLEQYGKGQKKEAIVVTEIPYGVNKAKLVATIKNLAIDNPDFKDIDEVRDESDRNGVRIVIELKRDALVNIMINLLLKRTALERTITMNHVCLVDGHPRINLNLKELLSFFLLHATDVITNRSRFELDKVSARRHIVNGYVTVLSDIDNLVDLIRGKNRKVAAQNLMDAYNLDEGQAKAVLELHLWALNEEDIEVFQKELEDLTAEAERLNGILTDQAILLQEVRNELKSIVEKYFSKDARLTEISNESDDRDTIPDINVVVAYTHGGFVKSVKEEEYNGQKRAGKGNAFKTKEGDFVESIMSLSTHDDIVAVSNTGKGYVIPAYKIPTVSKSSIGKPINNYVPIAAEEKIISLLAVHEKDIEDDISIIFVTKNGTIKRLSTSSLPTTRAGARIIKLEDGDEIVSSFLARENDKILSTTHNGLTLMTTINDSIRVMGRAAGGVCLMKFKSDDDYIVSAAKVEDDDKVFLITENGLGKRFSLDDFTPHNRGSKGMTSYKPNEKSGKVAAMTPVHEGDSLFVVTQQNMLIRIDAEGIPTKSRVGAGVRVIRLEDGDSIASIGTAPIIDKGESDEQEE